MAKNMTASGTIRVSRFVKKGTGNHDVVEADSNDLVEGISQEGGREAPIPSATTDPVQAAVSGDLMTVYDEREDNCLLCIGSGGVTRGDELISDADGKGVTVGSTAATIYNVGATALEDASEDELCKVRPRIYTKTTPAG